MWRRILAVLIARNREFYRDRAGLGWSIFMPILMVLAFAFIFSGEPQDQFKVGVVTADGTLPLPATGFLALEYIQFVPLTDLEAAITKVDRHQLDLLLLLDLRPAPIAYWVNLESPRGYLAERLLLGAETGAGGQGGQGVQGPERRTLSGAAVRYADCPARYPGHERHVLQPLGRGLGDRALPQERCVAAAQGDAVEPL